MEFVTYNHHKIKEVFGDENGFNDWLAENLEFLSEIFSANFQLVSREAMQEGLRVDILTKFDVLHDDQIIEYNAIIETQLNQSDSKHFGQLITYGAQHDAKYCIWIAEDFRPGHIEAIRILNETNMDKNRFYFPVKVEVVSIGNSEKVIKFQIITSNFELPFESPTTKEEKISQGSVGEVYWYFFSKIIDKFQNFPWFKKSKSTKNNYLEISSGLKTDEVYFTYGFRFTGGKYQLFITVREKDRFNPKSESYVIALSKYLKSRLTDLKVKAEDIEYQFIENRIYNLVLINYPGDVDIQSDENLDKLLSWSEKFSIMRDLTQEKILELIQK
ncbi:MAG: hypothetical protein INQ03_24950 [Candidatus Heimdallarchaeota archaeon]|nr:hypothetical protein [Candidatus Heimdallarchaeota archaeon]